MLDSILNSLKESIVKAGVIPMDITTRKSMLGVVINIGTTHALIGTALCGLLKQDGWKVLQPDTRYCHVVEILIPKKELSV